MVFCYNYSSKISNFLKDDSIPTNKPISSNYTYDPAINPTYFIQPQKDINLIEIPQAFYGSRIEPGTLNLKIYIIQL